MSFVKLDTGILLSSIWSESPEVRVVWITLLAMADQHGLVAASATGVAKMAGLPLETVCAALDLFQSPDPHSRTPDHDGRRLARVDGGFILLNYEKYRDSKDLAQRREQVREATRRWREKGGDRSVISGDHGEPLRSRSEAEADQKQKQNNEPPPAPQGGAAPGGALEALVAFSEAFNAAYERKVKPPTLNKPQATQFKRLVSNYGIKGACCLPLLAWLYDRSKDRPTRQRAVSHLLHDGERGTFNWASLLETAPSLLAAASQQRARRIWQVAEWKGLTEALEGFGCVRPEPELPLVPSEPLTPERLKAIRYEAEERVRREQGAMVRA